ncbi:MAG: zinc-ribbon domain-containing protein [Acetivibrionales bacterium]|jgi:hypothetical protein
MKFCVFCGAQLDSTDRFCTACGKSIANLNQNAGQQSSNTGASPIPPQSQQYTPPVSLGQQSSSAPGQYTPPVPLVQQTYTPPQQFAGPPPYHPGASSSHNYASPGAPQPRPGGSNPFSKFSQEMNTGSIQKRTRGRGMLLGGIIGLIVLAIMIGGIIIALSSKDSSGRNDDNPKDKKSNTASIDKDAKKDKDSKTADKEKSSNKLPKNVKADAQLSDIVGYWEGTIFFTRMEGFENIPEEDLPPDFDMRAFIAEVMASPVPMEIEFEEDGSWELDIDLMDGMLIGSQDYDREKYEVSPLIIKKLDKGSFNVGFTEKINESGISGETQLHLSGSVVEEDGELSINGTFLISLEEEGIVITEEGDFTVFPQE